MSNLHKLKLPPFGIVFYCVYWSETHITYFQRLNLCFQGRRIDSIKITQQHIKSIGNQSCGTISNLHKLKVAAIWHYFYCIFWSETHINIFSKCKPMFSGSENSLITQQHIKSIGNRSFVKMYNLHKLKMFN